MSEFFFKKAVNYFLRRTWVSRIKTAGKEIFLTFDDGPEPGITEFVLDELKRYHFKATFFCKGSAVKKYPELYRRILAEGHAVGNHTWSHIPAYLAAGQEYVEDVSRAGRLIPSKLFRPPNGCLTFLIWLALRKKYKIIYWTIGSGDWCKENLNVEKCLQNLTRTQAGDIILFHFSLDLETGTRQLLPPYLDWLHQNGFYSEAIPEDGL